MRKQDGRLVAEIPLYQDKLLLGSQPVQTPSLKR